MNATYMFTGCILLKGIAGFTVADLVSKELSES